MKTTLAIGFALLAPSSATYVWPNNQDSLDDHLYLQDGYIKNGQLSDQVGTCSFGAFQPGIQKAAEWVRTAFHDSVTHDASTKTGGLDASIQYELDRPENLGAALNNTLSDISSVVDMRTSAADLIALALVMSVARCGDMRIPLRTGRKDATEAGIKGVPEAHTDLETSRKRFATASLDETDMITLIACGHSIGSVHSVDHPEIVSGEVTAENIAHFDTTSGVMDNAVVLEYLDNSTSNPLIRNANDTLNSDKRIFAADDNKTMKKLADGAYFKAQCEAAFEKMLNLVPGDVTLSEPMVPADIRPYIETYELSADGSIEFSGRLRIRVTPVTGRDADTLTASLIPSSRDGSALPEIVASPARFKGGQSSGYLDERFQWFEFSQTLKASETFNSFNIRVNDVTYDNGGTGGYPVNGDVLFQSAQSCVVLDGIWSANITAAVSKALLKDGVAPQMRIVQKTVVQGNVIPRMAQEVVPMTRSSKETAEYVYFTASKVVGEDSLYTTLDLEVGDSKIEYIGTGQLTGGKECGAL